MTAVPLFLRVTSHVRSIAGVRESSRYDTRHAVGERLTNVADLAETLAPVARLDGGPVAVRITIQVPYDDIDPETHDLRPEARSRWSAWFKENFTARGLAYGFVLQPPHGSGADPRNYHLQGTASFRPILLLTPEQLAGDVSLGPRPRTLWRKAHLAELKVSLRTSYESSGYEVRAPGSRRAHDSRLVSAEERARRRARAAIEAEDACNILTSWEAGGVAALRDGGVFAYVDKKGRPAFVLDSEPPRFVHVGLTRWRSRGVCDLGPAHAALLAAQAGGGGRLARIIARRVERLAAVAERAIRRASRPRRDADRPSRRRTVYEKAMDELARGIGL